MCTADAPFFDYLINMAKAGANPLKSKDVEDKGQGRPSFCEQKEAKNFDRFGPGH
jgi:hypothetical protein